MKVFYDGHKGNIMLLIAESKPIMIGNANLWLDSMVRAPKRSNLQRTIY